MIQATRSRIALLAIVGVAIVAVALLVWRSINALPAPGSDAYEQVTRAFYRGLASLDVGLLDDAKREFTAVTTQVAEEPAGWANLGLAHLRLGELEEAAAPIDRAVKLAPDNADLVALAGRMEIARGRLDEGLAHLRRAAELAPQALRPRFALAEEVERAGTPDGDAQALALLDELVALSPQNIALLVERARIAAKARDQQRLRDSMMKLEPIARGWPASAVEQYQALQQAVAANDASAAQRSTAFLRNVLARVPAFTEDLSAVRTPTELIAEPIDRFVVLVSPSAIPASPDTGLSFSEELLDQRVPAPVPGMTVWLGTIPAGEKEPPQLLEVDLLELRALTGPDTHLPFPRPSGSDANPTTSSVAVLDWNNDSQYDVVLAGEGGVRLFIKQADGRFVDQTPRDPMAAQCRCVGAWGADIEMDGDIDVIASDEDGSPFVLRNNGDQTWTGSTVFTALHRATDFAWADIDNDGDPDAVFLTRADNGMPAIHTYANRQAGDFVALPSLPSTGPLAMTVADLDADGLFEVVTLEATGVVRSLSFLDGQWRMRTVATWPEFGRDTATERLIAADFDNNGAIDLIGTRHTGSHLWLGNASRQLELVPALPAGSYVFPTGDLNGDGRLDLAALVSSASGQAQEPRVVRLMNRGKANYHWKVIRLRAQLTAGDQRVNSFGAGGYLEARAGLLFQKQRITGGPVHIGLGTQRTIDVARIVWPNGVPQAEFGTSVDDSVVVEQRLKGSCPWIFTWDGRRITFVTDFLWRSPLGLRINAQDTAGVTQTEDWVRLRGDQLVPRDGFYDVRITAELWETHFFDHVSLMAVDHPDGTEVFVDERFSPTSPPAYEVHVLTDVRPVPRAWDHRGADVTGIVAARDGAYLSTFKKGRYQGIAEDHYVEIDPGTIADGLVLVATGWIYPTDSSINVAISQAGITPRGLSLEAQNADGSWRVADGALGFPAGKNKTLVIDLKKAAGARRIRLTTNLEIYWDSLQLGSRATVAPKTTRLVASAADLRYRGFSQTTSMRGDAPETPEYDRMATTSPRWRDLTGYHTRFGDVRELIEQVDDRYVIMNAGDEIRLQFPEAPPLASGWRRDFVLIGDGWEKDGDYNTGFSQTVLPLPSHDRPAYGAERTSLELEDDPVYQRHRADWERYHTRYVTPQRFLRGLNPQ